MIHIQRHLLQMMWRDEREAIAHFFLIGKRLLRLVYKVRLWRKTILLLSECSTEHTPSSQKTKELWRVSKHLVHFFIKFCRKTRFVFLEGQRLCLNFFARISITMVIFLPTALQSLPVHELSTIYPHISLPHGIISLSGRRFHAQFKMAGIFDLLKYYISFHL